MRRAALIGRLGLSLMLAACSGEAPPSESDGGTGADAGHRSDASGGRDAQPPSADGGEPADAGGDDDAGAVGAGVERIFGVTLTDPWALEGPQGDFVLERIQGLTAPLDSGLDPRPTIRVVFDEGVDETTSSGRASAQDYASIVARLTPEAQIMGELLDSFYVASYTVDELQARACEYRAALGHEVDLWEVGNEINGEWVGPQATEKLESVIRVFLASTTEFERLCPGRSLRRDEKPIRLALTFYGNGSYNDGIPGESNCWSDGEHAMLRWAQVRFGEGGALAHFAGAFDYIWVSYYEEDCDDIQPDWQPVFEALGELFPTARLGFGECGTAIRSEKLAVLRRYYEGMSLVDAEFANMHVTHPRYVGGMFWWYFSDDLSDDEFYENLRTSRHNPFWQGHR